MATEESKHERSWPAIVGWGGLAVLSIAFVYLIRMQLGESWAKREQEAIQLVKNFQPDGTDTLYDLTRRFSIEAKKRGTYAGEFSWDAKQKAGPMYEVTLMWREGEQRKVSLWQADLKTNQVRPQGSEAAELASRARRGGG